MKAKSIIAAALLVLTVCVEAAPLKIGWAINDISTDQPVELAGTFHWRHSKGLRDQLTTTALAIDNGEDSVIFASIDMVVCRGGILDAVIEKLEKIAPEVPFDKIVLTELDGADVECGTVRDIPPYGFCKGFVVGGEDIAVCEACA